MFRSVTLEVSLKPFVQTDEAFIRRTCAGIFEQWRPLLKGRQTVSVMLWAADGSEILDYTGDADIPFEWCRYIGTANRPLATEEERAAAVNPHARKQLYIPDPPVMTYAVLHRIVTCLKEEGARAFPAAHIRVGETFDIGPEFAVSAFKYQRHPEICTGSTLDSFGFVDATLPLHADSRAYAAYPDGIPEGTPFASFFGRQAKVFLRDMGFDYLWLSNGLGFSDAPWSATGKIYDGEAFHPERLAATRRAVFDFWRLFREACPDVPLEVRGTNNSVGIDYATDGVPLHDIYSAGFDMTAPPNSPWAALNDNYGLEIMGHMTRVCELPCEDFMFRYYIHDPWWMNTPWYDRYDGFAGDIYLPMAVCRLDEQGRTQSAATLNILSIDNSRGGMPDSCVYEPLPHLLKAEKDAPDAPGPLVWVYPMREYTISDDAAMLNEMYRGDTFVSEAINRGLPLTTVVSSDNFLRHPLSLYTSSVIISPVQPTPAVTAKLAAFAAAGGRVISYGTAAALAGAPAGAVTVQTEGAPDALREALETFGLRIRFVMREGAPKPPTLTVSRHDNALIFSVYNADTTTDTLLSFPLGAPILSGGETAIENGFSRYRFARAEHRECRVFVQQADGVVSLHEAPPVNAAFRRRVRLSGLSDATVCFFPETYAVDTQKISRVPFPDETPVWDDRWQRVDDPVHGCYYRAEHITGEIHFLAPVRE